MAISVTECSDAPFRSLRVGLAISVIVHLLWVAFTPAPMLMGAPGSGPGAVRVAYDPVRTWKVLRDERPEDPRWIRSTALLVLPSPDGFSGLPVEELVFRDPSWLAPTRSSVSPAATRVEEWGPLLALERDAGKPFSLAGLAIPEPPVFAGLPPPSVNSLHITWDEGFGPTQDLVVPAYDAAWTDSVPWEAACHVAYDDRGQPTSLLLEPEPVLAASRRIALMRLLQTTAAPTGIAGRASFVKIRYTGPTGARP